MSKRAALIAATTLAALVTPLVASAAPAAAATPSVMITKVYVNAPGTDTTSNTSVNGEYVVIKNTTRSPISLGNWTLRDRSSHVYTFPGVTLKPGYTFTVHTGKGTNTSTTLYEGRGWHIWNNDGGDAAYLRNSHGTSIDSCAWSGHIASYVTC